MDTRSKTNFFAVILISAAISTPVLASEYEQLRKADYESLLPGKTIKGEYRFMRERTKTYHFEEQHFAGGTTTYTEGDITEDGVWFTVGDQKICYKYPNDGEMGGGTSCFWVYLSEGCYFGYGINVMTVSGPRDYDDWSARWIIEGSGNSCAVPIG